MVEFCSKRDLQRAPRCRGRCTTPRRQDLDERRRPKITREVGLLLQSPVLYLNGHGPMPFVGRDAELLDAQEKILKKYVEEGGFLVAEACCGDKEFAASFQRADRSSCSRTTRSARCRRSTPSGRCSPASRPADFPELDVLERGCRTVAVFSPSPLAGYWEERGSCRRRTAQRPEEPRREGVLPGAEHHRLRDRDGAAEAEADADDPGEAAPRRGDPRSKFKALQLKYISDEAQQPPAADALRNLMGYLGDNARLDVALTSEVLAPGRRATVASSSSCTCTAASRSTSTTDDVGQRQVEPEDRRAAVGGRGVQRVRAVEGVRQVVPRDDARRCSRTEARDHPSAVRTARTTRCSRSRARRGST